MVNIAIISHREKSLLEAYLSSAVSDFLDTNITVEERFENLLKDPDYEDYNLLVLKNLDHIFKTSPFGLSYPEVLELLYLEQAVEAAERGEDLSKPAPIQFAPPTATAISFNQKSNAILGK